MIVSIFVMFGIGYFAGKSISKDESVVSEEEGLCSICPSFRSYSKLSPYFQRMICGLVGSITMMIVEMSLFILRALRMESAYEKNPNENSIAKTETVASVQYTRSAYSDRVFAEIDEDDIAQAEEAKKND